MLEWLTGEAGKAWTGWWPAGAGLALLAALLAARRLRSARRRHSQAGGHAPAPERETETHAEDVSALLRDLDRLAADFESRLNATLARVDAANRAADERIARLDALLGPGGRMATSARIAADTSGVQPAPIADRRMDAEALPAAGRCAAPQAAVNPESASALPPREARAAEIPVHPQGGNADLPRSSSDLNHAAPLRPFVSELHARVYALADAGRSAMQIAETVGRPLGEIELLLQLRALH